MVVEWWFFTPEMWHNLTKASAVLVGLAVLAGLLVWLAHR